MSFSHVTHADITGVSRVDNDIGGSEANSDILIQSASIVISLVVSLPVGVVLGCCGMWCAMRRARKGGRREGSVPIGMQESHYDQPGPVGTTIPLSHNQAYASHKQRRKK